PWIGSPGNWAWTRRPMSDTPHHAAQPTEHFARAGTADLPLFLDDQRRRWRLGQRALVESYVERHPALVGNPEHLLDLIYNEVVLREKAGETPRLEEYLGRFPHLADRLKEQFALDEVLWSRCRPAPP